MRRLMLALVLVAAACGGSQHRQRSARADPRLVEIDLRINAVAAAK